MTALPRILYRSSLSLILDPRGAQKFMNQVLNAVDLESDDPVLGSVDIQEVFEAKSDLKIVGSYHIHRSSDTRLLTELSALAAIMQALQPRTIFEIGTFVGRTTRLMAENSPPEATIVTLDLPQDQVSHEIGEAFKDASKKYNIQQIFGDSRAFNYSPWYGTCDFVWVDANHDYPFVVSDTEQALKLCKKGGWIGWHDYRHTAWWSGVTRAVRECNTKFKNVRHIRGTTIALMELTDR